MKPIAGKTASLLLGGSLGLLPLFSGGFAWAQSTEILLFGERLASPSDLGFNARPIEQAQSYDSVRVQIPEFDASRQSAHISGGPNLLTPVVIDNFMTINHACRFAGDSNICSDRPFGACFSFSEGYVNDLVIQVGMGDIAPDELGIDEILGEIPPIEVTDILPSGGGEVAFTLCDHGTIRGNTQLYLVIRDFDVPPPPPPPPGETFAECKARVDREFTAAANTCQQEAEDCEENTPSQCEQQRVDCVDRAEEEHEKNLAKC